MNVEGDSPARNARRVALKQVGISFFWKLFIVLAGIGAYYAITSMEKTKRLYDGAANAPVIVVDKTRTNRSANSIEFTVAELGQLAKGDFATDIKPYVERAKHQPFKNGDELLERLNQEISREKAADERTSQQQMDILVKQYAEKQTGLLTRKNRCDSDASPQASAEKGEVPCDKVAAQIASSENDYEEQKGLIQAQLSKINSKAANRLKAVYDFRPSILGEIRTRKENLPIRSFAYLFPADVLNDQNGSHVIYSTFWLICMVVLVFGVLFVALLLLRPLPPFAGGTEALTEQAKSFLSKRGASATPEIARTFIVTTAALGIGTAVAVAGGVNMPSSGSSTKVDVQAHYERGEPTDRWKDPPAQQPPIVNVPVTYPSPMTINIPSSDGARFDAMAMGLGAMANDVKRLQESAGVFNSKITEFDSEINDYARGVDRLDQLADKLQLEQANLKSAVNTAETDIGTLQGQATSLKTDFFNRMDAFNSTMHDLRNESMMRVQPRNRNIFGVAQRLFSVGNERYIVTQQSYLALGSLMCTVGQVPNPAATAAPSPQLCSLRTPCERQVSCGDLKLNEIQVGLKGLIGKGPKTESELMSALSNVDRDTLKTWKPIILRYTRIL